MLNFVPPSRSTIDLVRFSFISVSIARVGRRLSVREAEKELVSYFYS